VALSGAGKSQEEGGGGEFLPTLLRPSRYFYFDQLIILI